MGSRSANKVKFTSYNDLFGNESIEQSAEGQVIHLSLDILHSFKNHPFRVLDDEKMMETVDSVRKYGVLIPGVVRKDKQGGYEIVAGHRRKRACELAGYQDMPVIVRDLNDDEATIIMVDSNIQREDLLPSEKAKAYRMKMEALSHQGVKGEEYTADLIGKGAKKTGRTVQRYVRLTYLLPELLEYVDLKKLLLIPAEKLSFITAEEQGWVLGVILDKRLFPNEIQAEALKDESKAGTLNKKRVTEILISDSKMPSMPKITLSPKKLRDYFRRNIQKGRLKL